MKRYGIIGNPISHSISPAIYNAVFPTIGLVATFEAWKAEPEEVAGFVERLRGPDLGGMMVTVPYKERVMTLVDALDATAKAIGAVNCIVKRDGVLTGYNTDVYGFTRSLAEAGFAARGCRALVLGAGGAAHAVAYGLAREGAMAVHFANRTLRRAEEAAAHLRESAEMPLETGVVSAEPDALAIACAAADIVVNCTPLGMRHGGSEDRSPLDERCLRPGLWVYDTVYTPPETPLLRLARAAGANTVPGLEMLIYQAVAAVQLWTGMEPPVDVMRRAARKALGFDA